MRKVQFTEDDAVPGHHSAWRIRQMLRRIVHVHTKSNSDGFAASPGARSAPYAMSAATTTNVVTVITCRATCSVFGVIPLRAGRKACVLPNIA